MADISFIIGSGFSIPAGYPSTAELNRRLSKIDSTEIMIHSDCSAWFHPEDKPPNAKWMRKEERAFVQEFLQFYNSSILSPSQTFHYEEFYDFYKTLSRSDAYPREVQEFLDGFRKRMKVDTDNHNLIFQFNNTYNQLLAVQLQKDHELAHMGREYPHYCARFLDLVEELSKTYIIHFHSLNHDLYIEHLAHSDSIQGNLDDGFEEIGSPFFGKIWDKYEEYMVRMRRFTDRYSNKFNLYKLHGSIDHYWFHEKDDRQLIKMKRRVERNFIHKEISVGAKKQYTEAWINYYPDFLSGKTSKITGYEEERYYKRVFSHLKNNLQNSECVITIGYGFGDVKINDYLDSWYANDGERTLIIAGRSTPKSEFLKGRNFHFFNGGVEGMDVDSILEKIGLQIE